MQGLQDGRRAAWERYRGWPTWVRWAVPVLLVLALVAAFSTQRDSSNGDRAADTTEQRGSGAAARATAAREDGAEAQRRRAAAARRERGRIAARRERVRRVRAEWGREQAALQAQLEAEQRLTEEEHERQERQLQQEEAAQRCHPGYDPCLDPNASDYDCEAGRGDGPRYTGLVTVKDPSDPYDLDRDGDGVGCD